MKILRRVIVFDAAHIEAESALWAGVLGGIVRRDDEWHSIVVDGEWIMGIQLAPTMCSPNGRLAPSNSRSTLTFTSMT